MPTHIPTRAGRGWGGRGGGAGWRCQGGWYRCRLILRTPDTPRLLDGASVSSQGCFEGIMAERAFAIAVMLGNSWSRRRIRE